MASYNPLPALDLALFRTLMVIAAIGTVLTAGYMLWMLRSVDFGEPSGEWTGKDLADVDGYEWAAWVPLILATIAIGIYPNLVFRFTNDAVIAVLARAFGS
jgi:NADH-quinone oxidoreductase subunit M